MIIARPRPERGQEGPSLLLVHRPGRAGQHRDPAPAGQGSGLDLVAEQLEQLGAGADEDEPGLGAPAGEAGVLAQEPVPRVDGVASRLTGGGDDLLGVEIGGRTRPVQRHGQVGPTDVERGGVVLGVDRRRRQAQLGGGAEDADRDLAAVGDQEARRAHGPRSSHPPPVPAHPDGAAQPDRSRAML